MNIIVAQSGGPTCVINASLLGVVRGALENEAIDKVYGSLNGIEGILYDNIVELNDTLATKEQQDLLRQTPSSALKSCRHKLPTPDQDEGPYETIRKRFEQYGIGAFFYIGGNDSMDTVDKVSKYFAKVGCDVKVIGVPKTIDNDLMFTDHTPGYGSAAKYVATTVHEIVRDCTVYDLKSVTIIEIMGRDTGWLTAAAAVSRASGETAPQLIYLPEVEFDIEKFLNDIKEMHKTQNTVVVAISEGVEVAGDDYMSGAVDNFGHKYLSGVGKFLENTIRDRIGCKVRSIELNLMQRCSSHISSLTDITEAEQVGYEAVKAAVSGLTGKVMIFVRKGNNPYSVAIESMDACKIANQVKYFPSEWVTEDKNNIKDEALEYILPLIQGEQPIVYENGIPKHFKI